MHIWVTAALYHEIVLFQTYHAHVLGMDLSTNMINFALKAYESSKSSQVCEEKQWFFFCQSWNLLCNLVKEIIFICCIEKVQFEVSDASTREFPAERFDAVYSRETILHIKDKKALLKKILVRHTWLIACSPLFC